MRLNHFTERIASQPGTTSRSGYPLCGRTGSPFWAYATRMSSIALASGMLIVYLLASDPSATIQLAPRFTPHSLTTTDSNTPVHSLQLVRPCTSCTESPLGPRIGRLLALHSRK